MRIRTFPQRRAARLLVATVGAVAALTATASASFAHPLGNFTINHYAGVVVGTQAIALDVVIDQAEIPTVAERQRIDANGDGQVSPAEIEAERQATCGRLAPALHLTVTGSALSLVVRAAGLTFPPGAGGLATMRTVCEYTAALGGPLAAHSTIRYADTSSADRIGWREIVVAGDGVLISGPLLEASSLSGRLTSYPQSLLKVPLSMMGIAVDASPGGAGWPAPCIPDAFDLASAPTVTSQGHDCGASGTSTTVTQSLAVVPGGVGSEITGLLGTTNMTLPVLLLSLLVAMGLGAAHALTPGHGKTIMAAYLVGTRGTARHALALGLTVTLSHTIGVLLLAGVILALRIVTPDSYNHVSGILSGILVIGIGVWLFRGQGLPIIRGRWRTRRERRAAQTAHPHEHDGGHADAAATQHGYGHEHAGHGYETPHADHRHEHEQKHEQKHESGPGVGSTSPGPHRHGGIAHTHLPPPDAPITWRGLFALGLFGGLVPSINALIILLATVATGRAGYGLILVVAFGVGMALVLGGIGLGLVYAGRWMGARPGSSSLSRVMSWAPALTSLLILVVGVYVTVNALWGNPIL